MKVLREEKSGKQFNNGGVVTILIAGFGGQGVMSAGKMVAKAAVREGRYTTFFPSYGAEVRGGTAHCFVKISGREINSPIGGCLNVAIILNHPSWVKFSPKVKRCIAVINSDLCPDVYPEKNVESAIIPLNNIALGCGDIRTVNIAALGAVSALTPDVFKEETLFSVLKEQFRDQVVIEANKKSFYKGKEWIRDNIRMNHV